jgi:hypothetical protein
MRYAVGRIVRGSPLPDFLPSSEHPAPEQIVSIPSAPIVFFTGDDSFRAKRQRLSLVVAGVPSDQWPTGIMNSVIGSGAP